MTNPIQQTVAILFLGGSAAFAIWAVSGFVEERQRLDAIAVAAGFADNDEMVRAKEKGFDRPAPYRGQERRQAEGAKVEKERLAAAQAKAKAAEDAKTAAREARFREGAIYAVAIKKSMKNPDSFKLETAYRTSDGIFCFEYRATNSFNAIIPGRAFVGAGKAGSSDDGAKFAPLWNRYCGQAGEDFSTIVYAMKNGYF